MDAEIGVGEAITGFEKYKPPIIELFREVTYKNGNSTWKANALFCPSCSRIREKDTINGGFKDKWVVEKQDYHFTLNYQEDELNVEVGANKGALKRALVKSGNNKMLQRVILNQFVGQMAV